MNNFSDSFRGRPNTVRVYKSLFKCHIEGLVPEPLGEPITEQHLADFVRVWEGRSLSRQTIMSLLHLVKQYAKFYHQPCAEIRHLIAKLDRSEQQEEHTVLGKEQASLLMSECRRLEPKFYPVLLLGLHAGLRRGEVFGLRCADVDMLKGKVRVAHSYDGPTKNGRTRYVPMSAELVRVMTGARNLLFRAATARVFEIFDPNPVLRRVCYGAKLPELRFHDLRHTYATLALEAEVSPREVQKLLGHSNLSTTLNIYWGITNQETDVNRFLPGGEDE